MNSEAERMLNKYPERLPIIVKKYSDNVSRSKFLVPKEFTIGQLIYIIKRKTQMKPSEAIFIFTEKNILMTTGSRIEDIYEKHKNKDGFLYIIYSLENTFGL